MFKSIKNHLIDLRVGFVEARHSLRTFLPRVPCSCEKVPHLRPLGSEEYVSSRTSIFIVAPATNGARRAVFIFSCAIGGSRGESGSLTTLTVKLFCELLGSGKQREIFAGGVLLGEIIVAAGRNVPLEACTCRGPEALIATSSPPASPQYIEYLVAAYRSLEQFLGRRVLCFHPLPRRRGFPLLLFFPSSLETCPST